MSGYDLDLVQRYQSALAARDAGIAQQQQHFDKIAALEAESAERHADLERLDERLKRFTDPDEGQRLKQEFSGNQERILLLETAIRNLQRQTGKMNNESHELIKKCSEYHLAIFHAEYVRIANLLQDQVAELYALAKASGYGESLINAFPNLRKVDADPILSAIAARLGIPAKIPKAVNLSI